jgi:hypothetical protein
MFLGRYSRSDVNTAASCSHYCYRLQIGTSQSPRSRSAAHLAVTCDDACDAALMECQHLRQAMLCFWKLSGGRHIDHIGTMSCHACHARGNTNSSRGLSSCKSVPAHVTMVASLQVRVAACRTCSTVERFSGMNMWLARLHYFQCGCKSSVLALTIIAGLGKDHNNILHRRPRKVLDDPRFSLVAVQPIRSTICTFFHLRRVDLTCHSTITLRSIERSEAHFDLPTRRIDSWVPGLSISRPARLDSG